MVLISNSGAPWVSNSTHPRKFGSHVTVHRPPSRPPMCLHHRKTNIQSHTFWLVWEQRKTDIAHLLYGKASLRQIPVLCLVFFLGQDFAVRTVSMGTVQPLYFCFGAKPANSKFATKTAKKNCEYCHSSQ